MPAPNPNLPSSTPLATDAPRRRLSEPVPPSLSLPSDDLSFHDAPPSPWKVPPVGGIGSGIGGSGAKRKLAAWGLARRTLGICLLLVTVLLWTVSNFLASYIFSDHTYDKPFFVVYINTSIFAISMIPITIKRILQNGGFSNARNLALQAWHGQQRRRQSAVGRSNKASEDGVNLDMDVEDGDPSASERLLAGDYDDGSDTTSSGRAASSSGATKAGTAGGAGATDRLDLRDTARLSLEFCMLWFFANYFASACLEYTSVASVTILTSTSSVWTLVLCALLRIEPFSVRKLAGVLASLAGIVLISMVDLSSDNNDGDRGTFPHKSQAQIAIGDAMALVSAVVYGLYVVVMKQRVGNEDRVDMPLFFGLVGCFNIALLWPLFFVLHWTGIEPFEMPPTGQIWLIIMLNSIFSFISDMCWAYAMLLTTPLVVTVGLSLTIPLSLIGEMIQYAQYSSFIYWVGAFVVLLSFVFINHESHEDGDGDGDDQQQQLAAPGAVLSMADLAGSSSLSPSS